MSLRTYSLITHPAFLLYVESNRTPEQRAQQDPSSIIQKSPFINSISDIADYLGVGHTLLKSLTSKKLKHYRRFSFSKRSGGTRHIDAPRTFLKVVQWWILDTILSDLRLSDDVFGFKKGSSYTDNARFHLGARHLLNIDIADWFPSVPYKDIIRVFIDCGYSFDGAVALADLTTLEQKLPQGAPTSPALANLSFARTDTDLRQLAARYGCKYSRYADDITFSSQQKIDRSILDQIRATLKSYGYLINEKKVKFMGPNQRIEVTGLILGANGIALKREYLNSARGQFHRAISNPQQASTDRARLLGALSLIKHVGGRGTISVISLGDRAIEAINKIQKAAGDVRQVGSTPSLDA